MNFNSLIDFFKDNTKNVEVVKLDCHYNEYKLPMFSDDFDSEKSCDLYISEWYDEVGNCFTYEVCSGVSDDMLFQFDVYSDVGLFFDAKLRYYKAGSEDGKS